MKIDVIKQRELFFIIVGITLGVQILLAPMEKSLLQNSWLGVVLATALGGLIAALFGSWCKTFPGISWAEVLKNQYGTVLGKILIFAYTCIFFVIALNTAWYLAYFWSSLGLTKTPVLAYVGAMLVVIIILAYGGVTVLGRLANLIVAVGAFLIIVNVILMLRDVNLINLMPLEVVSYPTLLWTGVSGFLIVFGELFLLFPLITKVENPGQTGRTVLRAVLFSGAVLLLITVRNVGILGNTTPLYTFPIMQVLRLTEFGSALSRIEVFGALVLITVGMIRLGTAFLMTVTGLKDLWELPSSKGIIFPLAILFLALTEKFYNFVTDLMYLLFTVYPVIICCFGILLPLLTLVIAKIKKHKLTVIENPLLETDQ